MYSFALSAPQPPTTLRHWTQLEQVARPLVWMHAVSLGETHAAAILLGALRQLLPNLQLLLTHGTATGWAEGTKLLRAGDIQVWQPWDTVDATRRFFHQFHPHIGVVLETEIWPNLIASAQQADVPVLLVNARLSASSLRKALWLKALAKPAYAALTNVYAQTHDDANRLTLLGAKVAGVYGNLKFDITPNAQQVKLGEAARLASAKPVVLLASSREGEEALLLNALKALSDDTRQSVHWLIVPRHPNRFDAVAQLISASGFHAIRRTEWQLDSGPAEIANSHSRLNSKQDFIWLGDSVGEMAFYYSFASAALLGGSFEKLGGQNLIEALACGCPVVMGPHTFNFSQAASLAALSGVAFRANALGSAVHKGLQLCQFQKFDRLLATRFVDQHRGAAQRTAQAIAQQKVLALT